MCILHGEMSSRWGSLSVLIRIHGCWDLSLNNLALPFSLASLTGYWSGPMPSPLIQAMHPQLPACAWGPDLYEKSRTAGGHLVWLTPHIHVVLSHCLQCGSMPSLYSARETNTSTQITQSLCPWNEKSIYTAVASVCVCVSCVRRWQNHPWVTGKS